MPADDEKKEATSRPPVPLEIDVGEGGDLVVILLTIRLQPAAAMALAQALAKSVREIGSKRPIVVPNFVQTLNPEDETEH